MDYLIQNMQSMPLKENTSCVVTDDLPVFLTILKPFCYLSIPLHPSANVRRFNSHLQAILFTTCHEIPCFRIWWWKQANSTRMVEEVQHKNSKIGCHKHK